MNRNPGKDTEVREPRRYQVFGILPPRVSELAMESTIQYLAVMLSCNEGKQPFTKLQYPWNSKHPTQGGGKHNFPNKYP